MERKLKRSNSNRMLCGVCGGIADFFHIDATFIRLLWGFFCITGVGLICYILAAVIIPAE